MSSQLSTVFVNGLIPADILVYAGDGPTLIGNADVTNTLWIGQSNAIIAGKPDDTIQLSPQSWVVVDGKESIWGITSGPIIQVNLIPGGLAFFQSGITGGGFVVNSNGAFFYAGVAGPGTLICAITGTSASGTDQYGNQYTPGGMCIVAQPLSTSLFSVVDNAIPPDLLASIASDGSFSTEGTLSSGTDLTVTGLSLLNDILPVLPQGEIARTNVFSVSLPAPAGSTSSEFYLYELDVQLTAGRSYLLAIEPIAIGFSAAGKAQISVYATTDGSQPTNASPLVIALNVVCQGSAALTQRSATIYHPFNSTSGKLWRFLVSVTPLSTGSGTPTIIIDPLDTDPGDDSNVNARFSIYDMGLTIPNTGRVILSTSAGSGGGTRNYTKTYQSTGSHCYQGSDGGNSNLKINDNGRAYVCGDYSDTYNGKAKTWFTFNTATITSDLSGATINWVKIYLNNNHTWYGSGMTAPVGYDSKSSFGSTANDPSGSGIDAYETHFNEGQSKWMTVPNAFATNFQSGAANTIVLWRNSNNLIYYGYFSGGSGGCQMQINYTK
jgi:hypothetical protein